ncbi:MAG: O-antigen ligase family protein [Lachnospirales bacterium]
MNNISTNKIINYIGLVLLIAVVPLLMKLNTQAVTPSLQLYFGTEAVDIFINKKVQWFLVTTCIVGIYNILNVLIVGDSYEFMSEKIKNPITIGSLLIVVMAIVSLIFSSYKDIVFAGAPGRSESIFVMLGYLMSITFPIIFLKSQKDISWVMVPLLISSLIIGAIGAFQYLFYDIVISDGFSKYYLGDQYGTTKVGAAFTSSYSTLYNPNYLGQYTSMLIPLCGAILVGFKNKFIKLLSLLNIILLAIALIGSESETGALALCGTIGIMFIMECVYSLKNGRKTRGIVLLVAIVLMPIVFIISILLNPTLNKNFNRVLSNSLYTDNFFVSLDYNENSVMIENKFGMHTFVFENNTFDFIDETGTMLIEDCEFKEGYMLSAETSNNVMVDITLGAEKLIGYKAEGTDLLFVPDGNNTKFIGSGGESVDIHNKVPSIGFKNYQGFASNRGYIWSKSLPMVLDTLLIGNGSNTFIKEFPQYDVEGKLIYYKDPRIVVDKPHNVLISYSVNTGFLSLVGYLILLGFSIYLNIREYLKSADLYNRCLHLGLIAFIASYFINGFATDQNINVSPVFFVMLGFSYAIVYIKKDKKWFWVK